MKKKRYMAAALLCSAVIFSGCGAGGNENISAGMEQVEALEYDNALASFQAAREAKENERLILRGGRACLYGKDHVCGGGRGFGGRPCRQ